MDLIPGHKIDLVIDTPTHGRDKSRDGFLIRRTAIETGINCITAMDRRRRWSQAWRTQATNSRLWMWRSCKKTSCKYRLQKIRKSRQRGEA